MSQALTSTKLINSIKLRAFIPENQNTFTDDDFLAFANEEVMMGMAPMIMRHHEDYFLTSEEVPLVVNQKEYTIPSRAIGSKLRELAFKDNNGNIYEMTRIEIQDLYAFNEDINGNRPYAFYIKNNKVVLTSKMAGSVSGSLIMSFFMRPNNLVVESRVGIITNINTTTGEITLDEIPKNASNQSLISTTTKIDLISADNPFVTLNYDLIPTAVNVTTNVVTIDPNELPSDLKIGDYLNLALETIVPQIPTDLHMQLAMRVAMRCAEAMGDTQAVEVATQKLGELSLNASSLIDDRVEGAPRKLVNRHATIRSGLLNRRYRFRGR